METQNTEFEEFVDDLGEYLEHKGFSNEEIDEYFLNHYGVQGMKWGQRRTRRIQGRVDRVKRIARGEGTSGDRFRTLGLTPRGARMRLRNAQALQETITAGDARVADILLSVQGVRIRDLDYSFNT